MTTISDSPQIMGILNVTPDSFSDGGTYTTVMAAVMRARQMYEEGADIIDIGGESTRPGASPVSVQEELDRVMPVIEQVRNQVPARISVDTSKPEVMQAAIALGVDMINDVMALRRDGSLAAVAASNTVDICLMHLQGEPRTMQQNPQYVDVVAEVKEFLLERVQVCVKAGIHPSRIVIDPGFGFGKTLAHNLPILNQLSTFTQLGYRVLVGVSRKSILGTLLNKPVTERLFGSLALTTLAISKGANIIRTHDIAATVDALKVTWAVLQPPVA